MNLGIPKSRRSNRGQSLVETALMLPLLLLLVCNVVNLGYFFLVIVNLTGASRSSALYSIEGSYTPYAQQEAPSGTTSSSILTTPGTVAYTVYQDLNGAVWNPTGATVRVCTQMNINSGTDLVSTVPVPARWRIAKPAPLPVAARPVWEVRHRTLIRKRQVLCSIRLTLPTPLTLSSRGQCSTFPCRLRRYVMAAVANSCDQHA